MNCDNVISCFEAGANVIVSGSGSNYFILLISCKCKRSITFNKLYERMWM